MLVEMMWKGERKKERGGNKGRKEGREEERKLGRKKERKKGRKVEEGKNRNKTVTAHPYTDFFLFHMFFPLFVGI